jgi:hypothetical protein
MTVARLPSNFKQERGDRFMAERYGNSGARAMRFLPVEKKVV